MVWMRFLHPTGYTSVTNGEVQLGLNLRSNLPDDHPIQSKENERLGRGIEIVFEVDDIDEIYEHISAQDWPLAGANYSTNLGD